jgi:hypothetical protein
VALGLLENRGVQVAEVDLVFDDVVKVVGAAVFDAGLNDWTGAIEP